MNDNEYRILQLRFMELMLDEAQSKYDYGTNIKKELCNLQTDCERYRSILEDALKEMNP